MFSGNSPEIEQLLIHCRLDLFFLLILADNSELDKADVEAYLLLF